MVSSSDSIIQDIKDSIVSKITSLISSHDSSSSAHASLFATKADSSDIPTKTSELTNDSGFLTSHQTVNSWQQISGVTDGTLYVNTALKLAFLQIWKSKGYNYAKASTYYTIATIPSGYRPKVAVNLSFTSTSEWGRVLSSGSVEVARNTTGTSNISCTCMWCY